MLKTILYVLAIFVVAQVGKKKTYASPREPTIIIEVDLPWYIQFAAPAWRNFEPLSLTAKIHQAASQAAAQDIEFTLLPAGSDTRKHFRNVHPLSMRRNDVIDALLEYKTSNEQMSKHVPFNYTIQNKQFDVLALNVPLQLADINAAAAAADGDSESDELDEYNANMAQEPPQALVNSSHQTASQQSDLVCISSEAINAMETEKQHLEAQLEAAVNVGKIGTHLLLTGSTPPPPDSNAADAIRAIITDKLQLSQLSHSILQARFVGDELLFELATPLQKLQVLAKANLLLQRSPYKIISTERNIYDVALFARSKDLI